MGPLSSTCHPETTPDSFWEIIRNLEETEEEGLTLDAVRQAVVNRFSDKDAHMSSLSSLFLNGWKGSLPVAAWKNVAPTLHKST